MNWTAPEIKERIQQYQREHPNKERGVGVSMKSKKEVIKAKCLAEGIYVEERFTKAAMIMLLHEKQDKKLEEDKKTAQSSPLIKGAVMTSAPGIGSLMTRISKPTTAGAGSSTTTAGA